jgi:hypothetical protein
MTHWNRSASLLGNKALESSIPLELTRRFPPERVPVNIDVVGTQENSWAMIQVTDFAGIEVFEKAIPEDFNFDKRTAILATTDRVISRLVASGQLPQ